MAMLNNQMVSRWYIYIVHVNSLQHDLQVTSDHHCQAADAPQSPQAASDKARPGTNLGSTCLTALKASAK
jgi:hypothetical protein